MLVGQRLLLRDTHGVTLTGEGDAMIEMARNILEANDRLRHFFVDKGNRERLRLGISEDFAMSRSASALCCIPAHRSVGGHRTNGRPQSAISINVSMRAKSIVIFVKRKPGDKRGRTAWREGSFGSLVQGFGYRRISRCRLWPTRHLALRDRWRSKLLRQ